MEHHDFPSIPSSLLPRVREIAPEFYEPLCYHTSLLAALVRYITDPKMNPYSRIRRHEQKNDNGGNRLMFGQMRNSNLYREEQMYEENSYGTNIDYVDDEYDGKYLVHDENNEGDNENQNLITFEKSTNDAVMKNKLINNIKLLSSKLTNNSFNNNNSYNDQVFLKEKFIDNNYKQNALINKYYIFYQ